ncbi:MAG: hypothetical protein VYC39_08530 [Myxococcota bacterium]|nr:hypothetical protein [Myxococcota bacterium]
MNPVVFQKTIQFRRTKNPLVTALKKPNVRKLRTIAGEVVSLSNCELLKNSSGEELIVVTTSEILVFGQRDDFLRILGRFPLQRALSRSTFRSRYPHGFARCTESNDGTKSLLLTQSGYTGMATLVFNEANISNPEFLLQQESVQITSSKGIETFEYTPRRPWFKASHDKSKRPSRAYLEFAFPKVDTTYALLSDYTIHRLGTEAIPTTVQHTSGLGFSAFTGKDNGINFVTTSSLAADKTDRIKVIRESDGTVVQEANLPGRVKASSILRNTLAGRSRIILALRSNSGRLSQLFEWEILE